MGLIGKTLKWITHPSYSDANPVDWLAFLAIAIIAIVAWNKVVKQTLSAA